MGLHCTEGTGPPLWVRGCRIGPLYPPACRTRRLNGGGNLFAVGCGLCRGTRGSVAVLASSGSLASALDLGLESSYTRGWVSLARSHRLVVSCPGATHHIRPSFASHLIHLFRFH